MSLMKRLESYVRPWAIPNITSYLIAGQILLYVYYRIEENAAANFDVTRFWLMPGAVFQGEVWRLVTFIFSPPLTKSLLVIFFWLILYLCGTSLERVWGTVRLNVYILLGILAMLVADFAIYFVVGPGISADAKKNLLNLTGGFVDTSTFLYSSLFLAFCRLFPDYVFRLFLILPIRVRWLGIMQWCAYGFLLLRSDGVGRVLVLASVFNYLVFFARGHWRDVKHGQRRRAFQAKTKEASKPLVHECRICGLDSETAPRTLFRYCSKCAGQCCYCPDHIHNHEHVGADNAADEEAELAETGRE